MNRKVGIERSCCASSTSGRAYLSQRVEARKLEEIESDVSGYIASFCQDMKMNPFSDRAHLQARFIDSVIALYWNEEKIKMTFLYPILIKAIIGPYFIPSTPREV